MNPLFKRIAQRQPDLLPDLKIASLFIEGDLKARAHRLLVFSKHLLGEASELLINAPLTTQETRILGTLETLLKDLERPLKLVKMRNNIEDSLTLAQRALGLWQRYETSVAPYSRDLVRMGISRSFLEEFERDLKQLYVYLSPWLDPSWSEPRRLQP